MIGKKEVDKVNINLGYFTEKVVVTKHNIDKFEFLTNTRRQINRTTLNKLYNLLKDNIHFDTPIMCNMINGSQKYRLLDGNHRMEAIKKFLEKNPDKSVEVLVCLYKNLDEDEEKTLYTKWNLGKKQSIHDVLQQYRDEIPLWSFVSKKSFPCRVRIYADKDSLPFKDLLVGYRSGIADNFDGGMTPSAFKLKDEARDLEHPGRVANTMEEFINVYQNSFGNIQKGKYTKTSVFYSIFRIWLDNRGYITTTEIESRFHKKLLNNPKLVEIGKSAGAGATKDALIEFVRILNRGIKNKEDLFLIKAKDKNGNLRRMSPGEFEEFQYS